MKSYYPVKQCIWQKNTLYSLYSCNDINVLMPLIGKFLYVLFIKSSMDIKKFLEIKNAYDDFYKSLMKNGKLPMWSTEKGFWNASISDEVYSAFKKIKLQNYKKFLDLGSGDGKIALIASLFCKQAEGIEIDSVLHNKAVEMKQKTGISNVIFHNKDFFEHKLSAYDIIFLA